jgi:hypothetical protein
MFTARISIGTLQTNWVVPTADPNKWLVSFQWSHNLTGDVTTYTGLTRVG